VGILGSSIPLHLHKSVDQFCHRLIKAMCLALTFCAELQCTIIWHYRLGIPVCVGDSPGVTDCWCFIWEFVSGGFM